MFFQSFCILTPFWKSFMGQTDCKILMPPASSILVFLRLDLHERAVRQIKKKIVRPWKNEIPITLDKELCIMNSAFCFILKFWYTFPSSLLFMITCSAAWEKLNHSETGKRTKHQKSRRKEKSVFLREERNYLAKKISRKLKQSGNVYLGMQSVILLL